MHLYVHMHDQRTTLAYSGNCEQLRTLSPSLERLRDRHVDQDQGGTVATTARLSLRVTKSRTASKVVLSTVGSYAGLPANNIDLTLSGQPLYTTASSKAFWLAVLAAATVAVEALP